MLFYGISYDQSLLLQQLLAQFNVEMGFVNDSHLSERLEDVVNNKINTWSLCNDYKKIFVIFTGLTYDELVDVVTMIREKEIIEDELLIGVTKVNKDWQLQMLFEEVIKEVALMK